LVNLITEKDHMVGVVDCKEQRGSSGTDTLKGLGQLREDRLDIFGAAGIMGKSILGGFLDKFVRVGGNLFGKIRSVGAV
jgi:hypothetical protein